MDAKGQDMGAMKSIEAVRICEDILREERRYNGAHDIWPSQTVIIDRMLARQVEVQDAYGVLCDRLAERPAAVQVFLRLLLSTAVVWKPEKAVQARGARRRLVEVNQAIAARAAELAALLDQREALHNHSGFYGDTDDHIATLIEAASGRNGFFQTHLRDRLRALSGQFDGKYWPCLGDVMRAVARDAAEVEIVAADPMTQASTQGSRASQADFFKALFAAIEENRGGEHGLADGFDLTDGAFASFATVVLDLEPDDLVDAAYVKRLRQRGRQVRQSD